MKQLRIPKHYAEERSKIMGADKFRESVEQATNAINEPYVAMNDDLSGERTMYPKSTAESRLRKGKASKIRIVSTPSRQYSENWERIFGGSSAG